MQLLYISRSPARECATTEKPMPEPLALVRVMPALHSNPCKKGRRLSTVSCQRKLASRGGWVFHHVPPCHSSEKEKHGQARPPSVVQGLVPWSPAVQAPLMPQSEGLLPGQ